MSIKIDQNRCIGCSACVEVCPGNLIKLSPPASPTNASPAAAVTSPASPVPARKAFIKHERDCWGCTSCVKACPKGAISLYLGADMGGKGARLTVETRGSIRTWRVTRPDGSIKEITVDSSESNKY